MSGLGAPAVVMAVTYGGEHEPGAIVGLYTGRDQYPTDLARDMELAAAKGEFTCDICGQQVGPTPVRSPSRDLTRYFIPFVADPASSGVTQCVPCFASGDHHVHTTEDVLGRWEAADMPIDVED